MSTVATEKMMVKRNDVTMKVDADVARMAKIVAEFEGKSVASYVSEILRPIVERELERHAGRVLKGKKGSPDPTNQK